MSPEGWARGIWGAYPGRGCTIRVAGKRQLRTLVFGEAWDLNRQQVQVGSDLCQFKAAASDRFWEGGHSPSWRLWRWLDTGWNFTDVGDLAAQGLLMCSQCTCRRSASQGSPKPGKGQVTNRPGQQEWAPGTQGIYLIPSCNLCQLRKKANQTKIKTLSWGLRTAVQWA